MSAPIRTRHTYIQMAPVEPAPARPSFARRAVRRLSAALARLGSATLAGFAASGDQFGVMWYPEDERVETSGHLPDAATSAARRSATRRGLSNPAPALAD